MVRKNNKIGFLLALPSLLGVTLFYLVPFVVSAYRALTQGVAEPVFVGGENFRNLFHNPVFRQALGNTLSFLALGIPLLLGIALGLSMICAKGKFTWQRWALLLPMVIPSASLCISWQKLWGGLLSGKGAFPLLLAMYLLKNAGYLSVIITGGIQALPAEYRECYCLDSSSELGYARTVLLPLLSPTLTFSAVVAVMNYFLLFREVYLLYGANPPQKLYMLQHFMNNQFYKMNYQTVSAAAILTVAALACVVLLLLGLQKAVKAYVE